MELGPQKLVMVGFALIMVQEHTHSYVLQLQPVKKGNFSYVLVDTDILGEGCYLLTY